MIFLFVTTKDGICHPFGLTLDTAVDIGGGCTGNQSVRQSIPRRNTQPTPAFAFCDVPDFHVDSVLESSENRHLTYEGTTHYSTLGNTDNLGSSSLGDVLMRSVNYGSNV